MSRLIEVYVEDNVVKGSIVEGNFFGVGEKGLLMILCDMPYHPYLLYENTMDSDEIQLV